MGRRTSPEKSTGTGFDSALLQEIRAEQRGSRPRAPVSPTEVPLTPAVVTKLTLGVPSKYVNAVGASKHLGISKATFFRLKKQGRFTPSPVTKLYHVDDLDNEVRGKAVQDGQDQKN